MDTSLVFIIFEIAFFIILSGFFSGAETAITASSEAKILQLKIQGNKKAAILYDLKLNKEKLIGAILLANTGFNSLSSSIMAAETVNVFGNEAVIYASLVITVVILIFSEILPKSYVFRNPDNFALAIAPVIKVIVTICSPVTSVIQ